MDQLEVNLNKILTEKETKIVPENIKKDVQIFDVVGTLEDSGENSNIKIFNTIEEMNNSTDNNDGDIALIGGINYVEPNTTEFTANALILPEYLPQSVYVDLGDSHLFDAVTLTGLFRIYSYVDSSRICICFESGTGGSSVDLYRLDSSTNQYKRQKDNGATFVYSLLNNSNAREAAGGDYTVSSLKVSDTSLEIWNYVKFVNLDVIGLYFYNSDRSRWDAYSNTYTATNNRVELGYTAFGAYGMITGTLDLSAEKAFNSLKAMTSSDFNETELTIAEPTKFMGINIQNKPSGFLDKRYVFLCYYNEMHGTQNAMLYFDDPNTKLYLHRESDGVFLETSNKNYGIDEYKLLSGGSINLSQSVSKLISLTPITRMLDYGDQRIYLPISYIKLLATNCNIINDNGDIVYKGGPKANEIKVGSGYYNIFGEWVEGTYEPV